MIEGEVRRVTLNLSGAVGVNSITSTEVTSDALTIGTPAINGTSVSFLVTAGQPGTNYILASAVLSSSETVKGYIRAMVKAQPCVSSTDGYDD